MLEFEKIVARHGEIVVQAILENLERYEGVVASASTSLEQRWQRLMQDHPSQIAA